ncbi:hypothetical protein BT69DRAFT_1276927 [Atractiella rhizophila]|nr:hypothetical protein BT69DRAFT_1276927 [Atractiella rhizophila]
MALNGAGGRRCSHFVFRRRHRVHAIRVRSTIPSEIMSWTSRTFKRSNHSFPIPFFLLIVGGSPPPALDVPPPPAPVPAGNTPPKGTVLSFAPPSAVNV